MKKQWLKKIITPLMLMLLQYLAAYPVLIITWSKIFAPIAPLYLWLLPLCSWAGFGLYLIIQKVPIFFKRSVLLAIAFAISIAFFHAPEQIIVATVVLTVFFVLPSYQKSGLITQDSPMSTTLLTVGIVLYLFAGLIAQMDQNNDVQSALARVSIPFLMLGLFLANHATIQAAIRREGKQPMLSKMVIYQNRIMVAGIVVVLLIVAGFNWLKQIVFAMIHRILVAIIWLIGWLLTLFQQTDAAEEITEGAQSQMESMPPAGEPALIWIILEKLMFVVTIVIIGKLIYLFLKKICPKIYHWLKKLVSERQAFKMTQSPYAYLENQESTFHTHKIFSSIKKAWGKRQSKRFNEQWMDAKTGQEKMRFLYRYYLHQQVKKGIKPLLSQTPKEIFKQGGANNLDADAKLKLEMLYEQARYGKAIDISEQQLQTLKKKLMDSRK
jgi:hypothetical protein